MWVPEFPSAVGASSKEIYLAFCCFIFFHPAHRRHLRGPASFSSRCSSLHLQTHTHNVLLVFVLLKPELGIEKLNAAQIQNLPIEIISMRLKLPLELCFFSFFWEIVWKCFFGCATQELLKIAGEISWGICQYGNCCFLQIFCRIYFLPLDVIMSVCIIRPASEVKKVHKIK